MMPHRLPTLADALALMKTSQRVMRRLGALSRRGFKVAEGKRFLQSAQVDGRSLFYRPSEIAAVVRQFEELELADLLAPQETKYEEDEFFGTFPKLDWENSDVIGRICDAVGAKAASIEIFGEDDPPAWRDHGEREAEAWFLSNFAYFYSRQNASYADIDERLRSAVALGRLMEWWRWWSEGYDQEAVSGRNLRERNTEKGKRPKRRKWAELIADKITCWEDIPESNDPFIFDTLEADLYIYRDSENLICASNGKETKLSRSSFEKRYLRPSLRRRGQ